MAIKDDVIVLNIMRQKLVAPAIDMYHCIIRHSSGIEIALEREHT